MPPRGLQIKTPGDRPWRPEVRFLKLRYAKRASPRFLLFVDSLNHFFQTWLFNAHVDDLELLDERLEHRNDLFFSDPEMDRARLGLVITGLDLDRGCLESR